ncbi:hypothetical protein C1645_731256 [Glomus cerebriforme]|uniref:Uncharacterized protein n=1 Tax=Glomus cerebriforme TaxID=658196 RepID=A0A397TLN4_9GLOM|nr:hypothetical protein C1645_731256 [Glomus cerebriforme]
MKYGINSIEDDANKIILAVLKDLDNTFFNEYLYSKDEEKSSLTLNNDNNLDLIDLSLKLANTRLDNFKFEENPNSYVKNKVYDQLKLKTYKEKYEKKRSEVRVIVKQTFVNIWKSLILSLQFMLPKSDLCEKCELMKMDIQYTTQHEKKMKTTEDYLAHLKRV